MSKNGTVDHLGVVKTISATYIDVEILNKSMCAACHAKSMCTMSDVSSKIIRVNAPLSESYSEGEEVKVVMRRTMGLNAVWICYVIPLVILMILLLSLPRLGFDELGAGLFSIAGVGVYYMFVWLFRKRIARDFAFTIEKQQ